MKIYKVCTAVLIGVLCSVGFAQAPAGDDAPTREEVLKMFEVMHVRAQMEQLMTMMTVQMKQQLHQSLMKNSPGMSAEDEAKLEGSAQAAMNVYPVSEMLDDMVPVYQRHMSKSDVEAIVAFYVSPAGQHLLTEAPAMMREAMTTIMPKMNARTQALVEKLTKQMGGPAPSAPLVAPPPPPPQ